MHIPSEVVSAKTIRGRIRLDFPPTIFAKEHQQRLPGATRVSKVGIRWGFSLPATPRVYRGLRKYFNNKGIETSLPCDSVADRIAQYDHDSNNQDVNFTFNFLTPAFLPPKIPKIETEPWDHQLRSFWFAVDRLGGLHKYAHGGALLGLDMGTGKTKVAIDLICNYGWWRTLVLCPQKVIPVWPYQLELHSSISYRVLPLTGPVIRRADELETVVKHQNTPLIVVTNYEALDRKSLKEEIWCTEWDCVILDEGHRIKAPGGKRSRWLGRLADEVPVRLELTGTKEPNTPLDIFAQARWIDRSYYGTRFSEFRGQYAILGPLPDGKIVKILDYKNQEDLAQRNFQFCIEVNAVDVQDLPEEHHVDVPVELEKKTRKLYDELEKEFVISLGDEEITAANILVKVGKLQEITGGYVRNPETETLHQIGSEKRDALLEKLEDLPPDEPIVIFYRFSPDAQRIADVCDEIGRPHLECSGKVNQLAEWQKATGNEVLICQISAGKEGVDLTRSRWAFYYSLGYQPGEFSQSKKRQHRHGQKAGRVTFFHMIARGTIDRKVYHALKTKQKVIDSVKELARLI